MNERSKRKRDVDQDVSFDALVTPNFEELARQFPDFGRAYAALQQQRAAAGGGSLAAHMTQDFSVALTKALLHVHWGLALTHLPLHHLCPPVPNRYFYIQWIQRDLLPLLQSTKYFAAVRRLQHTGLDIGTGATCIYPLLFAASAKQKPVRLLATDVDPESVELATSNVQSNALTSSITVRLVQPTDRQRQRQQEVDGVNNMSDAVPVANSDAIPAGPLRRSLECLPDAQTTRSLDFCMTNPPFYDDISDQDRTDPRAGDRRSRTAMTVSEGNYPGGEVGFVLDMVVDSLVLYADTNSLTSPPGWSSCMCGKKTSWLQLKHAVTVVLGPGHVQSTEFGPGHLTRWFLAWTFSRPQIRSPLAKMNGLEFEISLDEASENPCGQVAERIQEFCQTLLGWELSVAVSANKSSGQQRLQIRETTPAPNTIDASTLPEPVQRALAFLSADRRMQLLPPEGHFLLDVTLIMQGSAVKVRTEAYQHSPHGRKAIDKLQSQLQGETSRTNRRWRRKLKAAQQEHQQTAQSMEE